jgi:hypothetical protein
VRGEGTFILIFSSPNPLGHSGRLPWVGIPSIPKKWGFPIEVAMIGHLVCYTNLPYLSWALDKYRLHDNRDNTHSKKFFLNIYLG